MKNVILSCSLSDESKSRKMAHELQTAWSTDPAVESKLIDLRDLDLPLCDGGSSYGHPGAQKLAAELASAASVVLSAEMAMTPLGLNM